MKGFFNHIDHEWAVRFIESRIKDPNIIRLVRRMLNAGVVEDFRYEETEEGSGQGSVCSPVIANIYMHYVLLWWFRERIKPYLRGYAEIIVYADDFVCCFQYREDAEGSRIQKSLVRPPMPEKLRFQIPQGELILVQTEQRNFEIYLDGRKVIEMSHMLRRTKKIRILSDMIPKDYYGIVFALSIFMLHDDDVEIV